MERGTVKWWNDEKGFGFIVPDGCSPRERDVFVHYSVVEGDGRKTLRDFQAVEFEAELTPRGWLAKKVVRL